MLIKSRPLPTSSVKSEKRLMSLLVSQPLEVKKVQPIKLETLVDSPSNFTQKKEIGKDMIQIETIKLTHR